MYDETQSYRNEIHGGSSDPHFSNSPSSSVMSVDLSIHLQEKVKRFKAQLELQALKSQIETEARASKVKLEDKLKDELILTNLQRREFLFNSKKRYGLILK